MMGGGVGGGGPFFPLGVQWLKYIGCVTHNIHWVCYAWPCICYAWPVLFHSYRVFSFVVATTSGYA